MNLLMIMIIFPRLQQWRGNYQNPSVPKKRYQNQSCFSKTRFQEETENSFKEKARPSRERLRQFLERKRQRKRAAVPLERHLSADSKECEESADSAAADSADSVADSVLEYINYLGQLYCRKTFFI